MKAVIINDSKGNIWFSTTVEEVPEGLEKFAYDLPEGASMPDYMDMTDPENPVPAYNEPAQTYDIAQMSSDITDMQIALAELYETITGGNE